MASELYVETLKGLTSGANANTITVGSGQILYAPGHVLQVVDTTTSTRTDANGIGSWTSITDLNVTITPSSTDSKILLLANVACQGLEAAGSEFRGQLAIYDNANAIIPGSYVEFRSFDYSSAGAQIRIPIPLQCLHSPASTSAQTYTVKIYLTAGDQITVNKNGAVLVDGTNNARSSITAMEIAG